MAVSWGLEDGITVIYQQVLLPSKGEKVDKEEEYVWLGIAIITPHWNTIEAVDEFRGNISFCAFSKQMTNG